MDHCIQKLVSKAKFFKLSLELDSKHCLLNSRQLHYCFKDC